jgi:hypothetical protein
MDFIPSFSIALRLFFSLLLCFALPLASPSCPEEGTMKSKLVRKQRFKLLHEQNIQELKLKMVQVHTTDKTQATNFLLHFLASYELRPVAELIVFIGIHMNAQNF